jgi:hypothetical protein
MEGTDMQTKLTLRLSDHVIRQAKAYARRTGRSVSQMVADYFAALTRRDAAEPADLTPIVRSLKGILRGARVDRAAYRRHLEEKYR